MKVLYTNNYPMDEAHRLWRLGEYPGNHLFGTTHLDRHDIEVRVLPYRVHSVLAALGSRLRLGDLDRQYRAFFTDCDVVFSACQNDTLALAMLRSAGVFRRRLVAAIHAPFRPGLERLVARGPYSHGHDQLICMGPSVERHMREDIGYPAERLHVIPWGVDLDFYPRSLVADPPPGEPMILTAGKTGRDLETLIRAVDGLPCRLVIVTTRSYAPAPAPLPRNVEVICGPGEDFALTFPQLFDLYRRSSVVAVPLRWMRHPRGQTGVTSLLEAMALARPVIFSRFELLAFDVEAEGVGLWAEAGDAESWRRAILRLLDDPAEARRMGLRGRSLCESTCNMEQYAARLAGVLRLAVK